MTLCSIRYQQFCHPISLAVNVCLPNQHEQNFLLQDAVSDSRQWRHVASTLKARLAPERGWVNRAACSLCYSLSAEDTRACAIQWVVHALGSQRRSVLIFAISTWPLNQIVRWLTASVTGCKCPSLMFFHGIDSPLWATMSVCVTANIYANVIVADGWDINHSVCHIDFKWNAKMHSRLLEKMFRGHTLPPWLKSSSLPKIYYYFVVTVNIFCSRTEVLGTPKFDPTRVRTHDL